MEDAEDGEDVDPGDVVADDEVMTIRVVDVEPFDVPVDRQQQVLDAVVGPAPPLAEPRQRQDPAPPQLAARHEELRKSEEEDEASPEQRVEQEEQEDDRAAQHGGSVCRWRSPI